MSKSEDAKKAEKKKPLKTAKEKKQAKQEKKKTKQPEPINCGEAPCLRAPVQRNQLLRHGAKLTFSICTHPVQEDCS